MCDISTNPLKVLNQVDIQTEHIPNIINIMKCIITIHMVRWDIIYEGVLLFIDTCHCILHSI